mmetsp:Transcript_27321/g.41349  ORF Transcript_27321/g.41349 Transcript_27321/m.41349 type:complete len:529 (-) Transcript_27321:47-1633(-)|eukprot:CAMPEP_0178915040 /NCGR_PEP_ID=MMETSP0786-20121207/11784_1 /TAXON_ID=186022 /ORGANISM="Thalassionema frauenfeldii, Strain CCMP 1798" /LENGTH=528 /DNA_ID=CAMNT_0020588063 /DNA_START=160 /DNA_END=1746 /DNA_ORIENTATION=-
MPSRRVRRVSSLSSLAAVAALGVSSTALQAGRRNQRRMNQDVQLGVLTDPATILEQETKHFFERSSSSAEFPLQPPTAQLIEEDIQINVSPSSLKKLKARSMQNLAIDDVGESMEMPLSSVDSLNLKSERVSRINNRVATMPGFQAQTARERADEASLKYIESITGRDLSQAPRVTRFTGQKMYKESLSVPDSLMHFAREFHQERRISPLEEVELGNRTQEAVRLHSLYDDLTDSLCREPTDDEWCAAAGKINMEALQQVLEEGLEAKNKLVTSNLRMVQRVVNVYIQNGLGAQYNAGDMMQDGIMALIRAAEKFEPNRGFRFSTYAMYWIRSAVKRSQVVQSRIVPLPQRLQANTKRVISTQRELQDTLGRIPTKKELADALGMTTDQLNRCIKALDQRFYSLDEQIQNNNKPNSGMDRENTLMDLIDSRDHEDEHYDVSRQLLRQDLIDSLYRHLDRESAHMLMLRFGFVSSTILPKGYEGPLTIAQVSELIGMKPDKVRRRLIKALESLRYVLGQEWHDYDRILR